MLKISASFLLFFLLLILRRHYQLIFPAVWVEDGSQTLIDLIRVGPASILYPVNGYLVLVPKLISFISFSISFYYYPIISTILSFIFISFVGCCIAFAPTVLPYRFVLAILTFLVPTDPEVFGLPSYTFWWAGLLVFLVPFWNPKNQNILGRAALLIIGGLSSPVIIVCTALLFIRACIFRSERKELAVFVISGTVSFAQLVFILSYKGQSTPSWNELNPILIISKFFGGYASSQLLPIFYQTLLGFLILLFLLFQIGILFRKSPLLFSFLTFCWIATILLTLHRSMLSIIHPSAAGPRYFFYPYIFLSWLLVSIYSISRNRFAKASLLSLILLALINVAPILNRVHYALRWDIHIKNCEGHKQRYSLPILSDGSRTAFWYMDVSGDECKRLLSNDYLYSLLRPVPDLVWYPYSSSEHSEHLAKIDQVLETNWKGISIQGNPPQGLEHISSFGKNGGRHKGEITLSLNRGDHLLVRTGHGAADQQLTLFGDRRIKVPLDNVHDWNLFKFEGTSLPEKFLVKVKDNGIRDSDWTSVAFRAKGTE